MRLMRNRVCSLLLSVSMALTPTVSAMAAEENATVAQSAAEESAEISETVETVEEEGESASEYDAAYTGLANYGGNVWRYQVNGKVQWGYTGLVQYYGTWYYIEKGTLNWNYTGLTNYYGTWYYVENGRLNWGYTGLTNYYGTWYYVEKGVLNWNYTGLTNYYGTWYYVEKGVLNWKYSGLTNYYGTWYYIESGVLNWGYTGLTNYYNTWYYVEKGVLNWNYTGLTEYYGTKYYVEKGVLNWNQTAVSHLSELTDKFALTPMIAYHILQMCNNNEATYYRGPRKLSGWNGRSTSWVFTLSEASPYNKSTMKVDLTTGIGTVYYNGEIDNNSGPIDLLNRIGYGTYNSYWGKNFFNYFSYQVPGDSICYSYVWNTTGVWGISSVIRLVQSELGRANIRGEVFDFDGQEVKSVTYLGNTTKGRPTFSFTDSKGNQYGYLVADAVYNYVAVYDNNYELIGELNIMS